MAQFKQLASLRRQLSLGGARSPEDSSFKGMDCELKNQQFHLKQPLPNGIELKVFLASFG